MTVRVLIQSHIIILFEHGAVVGRCLDFQILNTIILNYSGLVMELFKKALLDLLFGEGGVVRGNELAAAGGV